MQNVECEFLKEDFKEKKGYERYQILSVWAKNIGFFEDLTKQSGYAHYDFKGKISQKALNSPIYESLTSFDILSLVDRGVGFFGGNLRKGPDGFIWGTVNTD